MKKIFYLVALVAISLLFVQNASSQGQGKHEGHKYVDLGLLSGLKWATCNVGATTPEEYGDYFAWGETEPKEKYSWTTYKYATDYDQLTKYCSKSRYGKDGFTDSKTVLDPEDDAATVNWGGKWRMPTKEEQYELHVNCTWVWTTENYVQGYRVTSNIEGYTDRSIFLPASGLKIGSSRSGVDEYGYYWSSTRAPDQNCALVLTFGSHYIANNFDVSRAKGCSVRAVFK